MEKQSETQQEFIFRCPTHENQQILFICAINDWHFDLLCKKCTSIHTQNHPKRLKADLKSFQQFQKQTRDSIESVLGLYQKVVQNVDSALKQKSVIDSAFEELDLLEKNIKSTISTQFEKLRRQIEDKCKDFHEEETIKIVKIKQSLQIQQEQVRKALDTKQPLSTEDWKVAAKKLYFREKLSIYFEEIEESLKQYKEAKGKFQAFNTLLPEPKILAKTEAILKQAISADKKQGEAKNTVGTGCQKTQRPSVMKAKKRLSCKNCNEQMEYLTENKKHLICRHCNYKQRNYVKKPPLKPF